jgi:uncharacterized protein YcbX
MRVAELWRYPVKGLRGESLQRVEVTETGFPGDGSLGVLDRAGKPLTGRREHRMSGRPATLGETGEPLVAGRAWESDDAAAAIREIGGEGAHLVRAEGGHAHDLAPLLLLTDGSVAQLGYDRRRYRANIVVEGAEGAAEQDWIRGRVRVGEVLLFVTEPCERCVITTIDPETTESDPEVLRRTRLELGGIMGTYCSVLEPGFVAVGDSVEVV